MKKNLMIGGLVVIVLFGLYYFQDQNHLKEIELKTLTTNNEALKLELIEQNTELISYGNRLKLIEETVEVNNKLTDDLELLTNDLENYEDLIDRLTSRIDTTSLENRKRAYQVDAVVYTDESTFKLPENGQVVIDSTSFQLDLLALTPPKYRDDDINERLNQYTYLFKQIVHPIADEKSVTDEMYSIKYENLQLGDTFEIELSYDLSYLLNLDQNRITVTITDEFESGSDYLPTNIVKKVYTGGYENSGTIEYYTYNDDYTFIVDVIDAGASLDFIYDYTKSLRITHISDMDEEGQFKPYEVLVLPEKIGIGVTWEDDYRTHMITAVGKSVDTIWGPQEAIEVTSRYDDNLDNWTRTYYTRELGQVAYYYYGMSDLLIEVEVGD